MVRLFGVLMTAAAIALVGIAATPRTAHACQLHRPRVWGHIADVTPTTSLSLSLGVSWARAGGARLVDDNGTALLFGVDRVYKGEAGPLIEVRTHAQGSACGIDLGGMGRGGGIVARTWRGDLSVNLCGSMVTAAELQDVPSARATRPTTRSASRTRATIRGPARVPAHRRCCRGSRSRRSRMAPTTVDLLARRSERQQV